MMTSSPKKWLYALSKFFFVIFLENVTFFKKIVTWKNIQNLIFHKKGYINFRRQMIPSLQKGLGSPKTFLRLFLGKCSVFFFCFFFLKKLLNNKIFSTQFVIKKIMLIFEARRLLSLKNGQMCPPPQKQ